MIWRYGYKYRDNYLEKSGVFAFRKWEVVETEGGDFRFPCKLYITP